MLKLVFSVFGVALAVTPVTAAPQETRFTKTTALFATKSPGPGPRQRFQR